MTQVWSFLCTFISISMQSDNVINSLNKSLTSKLDDNVFNDFADRVQTFIDGQKWIKKPISLSPLKCAQYGWRCIKPDILECVTCNAKLCAHNPKMENYEAYKACMKKIINDLKSNHKRHCPWPLTPAPENFVRMILLTKKEALSQFLKRVESSLCYQDSLPKIKESVLNDLGFTESQIASLCKFIKIKSEDAKLLGESLISLSATGWTVTKDNYSKKSILKCDNCLRSVWCGSFRLLNSDISVNKEKKANESTDVNNSSLSLISDDNSHDTSSAEQTNSEEPPSKKKRISLVVRKGEPFDPLHEHRPWCIWIHDGTDNFISTSCDNQSEYIPGWKIFVKLLLRNVFEFQNLEKNDSPSKEQLRNVKNMLEKWSDVVLI